MAGLISRRGDLPTSHIDGVNESKLRMVGWVSQPDTRGTTDVLWAYSSTIFICVWVMLHLNVPSEKDSELTIFIRKLKWFVLAMLAPELLMLFAGAFPITSKQLHWLVERQYLSLPKITKKEIWDKSKADAFAKVVAAAQTGWFTVQIVARAIQGLPVTVLELSTIALMTCTGATLFFWFYKPLNVETTTKLFCEASIAQILVEAGDEAREPYRNTPLDFAEPLAYISTQMPLSNLWDVKERPMSRIPNDRDSQLHSWWMVLTIAIPTAAFGTFQLIAWNFAFPAHTEKMLWRYVCLENGIVLGVECALEAYAIIVSGYTVAGLNTFNKYKLRRPYSLLFFIPGFIYFCARTLVVVEVIITLRALPAGCFQTVDWTSILPHI